MKTLDQIRIEHAILEYEQAARKYEELLILFEGKEIVGEYAEQVYLAEKNWIVLGAKMVWELIKKIPGAATTIKRILSGAFWAAFALLAINPGLLVDFGLWAFKAAFIAATGMTEEQFQTFKKGLKYTVVPIGSILLSVYSKRKASELIDKWQTRHGSRVLISTKKKLSKKDQKAVNDLMLKYAK